MRFKRLTFRQITLAIAMVSLLTLGVRPLVFHGYADKLPNRSLRIADPTQGATTDYTFNFDLLSASSVGSIRFLFCSDTPLIDTPCTPPVGLSTAGAALAAQTGETGFAVQGSGSDNEIIISRTAQTTAPGSVSYAFSNVVNPSAVGSYYVRVQTYASTDASGAWTDAGGLAYVINNAINISTYVPPYLLLCGGIDITGYDCATASGNYINFGELSSTATKSATSQIIIATNAGSGYGLWLDGSTMSSNNDVIPGLVASDVSRPGTSQFGLNLVANTTPAIGDDVAGPGVGAVTGNYSVPDRFRFNNGDLLASASTASDFRKYTVSYIINIAKGQPAGLYVSTLSYDCLANF